MSVDEDIERLREATRVAHEATKDLRAAVKEARTVITEINAAAQVSVDARIEEALRRGLANLEQSVKDAIERATTAVYARFDHLAAILMGETKSDQRKGHPTIPSLVQQVADHRAEQSGG